MKKTYKYYNNRKLYDIENSSYVNLTDILGTIREGNDVEVFAVDIESGLKVDVTTSILSKIATKVSLNKEKLMELLKG